MKKRMIFLTLVLCIVSSLVVPAYAVTDNSIASKVDRDMKSMQEAFFNTDAITVYSVEDGIITYAYKLTEDVTDYVTVRHYDDGSAVLEVWEEDRHNVLTVLGDGKLLFDGQPLKISYPDGDTTNMPFGYCDFKDSQEPSKAPGRFSYQYSYKAFPGTSGYYSTTANVVSNPNIQLSKKIREETGAIIGSALAAAIFPGNELAEKASSKIFSEIGARLRSRAEAVAEEGNKLSYKSYTYSCSKSTSFDLYRKFRNLYYTNANFQDKSGKPLEEVFYEYRAYTAG